MADFVDIVGLNLGNTFGGWYNKTTEMITRLNALNVASITGGDGIIVSPHTAANGGYTLTIAGSVSRDMTFNNVTVTGNLVSNFAGAVSGTTIILPANTGVTVGNIVYIDSTGKLEKALADDECTAEVVGIVIGFTGGSAQVATTGRISGSSIIEAFTGTVGATLQKGVVYFLSGGVSGAGTTLEPDVTSYVSKPMLLGLTGDSGLILPYRGFIATEGTLGNTTIVQGVCGGAGVLSLNGITAALWNSGLNPTIPNLRQTGHLHALTHVSVSGDNTNSRLTKSLALDLSGGFNKIAPLNSGGIPFLSESSSPSAAENTTKIEQSFISNPNSGFIFSTDGVTNDVYRIAKIKIIPRPQYSQAAFAFSLQKEYNLHSGTTAISSLINNLPEGSLRVELRRTGYAIAGQYITSSGAAGIPLSYTAETVIGSSLITSDIHTIRYTPSAGEVFTYGLTTGLISGVPNSAGSFPMIYSNGKFRTRTNTFTIDNVIIGGANTPMSKYIKASNENLYYFTASGSAGYTMESAILGWNAQYGAVSESLYFVPVSLFDNISFIGPAIAFNVICDILLEMYKFDVNTRTSSSNPIIISTSYTLTAHKHSYSGALATTSN
jgi:hypothetical protein